MPNLSTKYCLITNDVETTSLQSHRLKDEVSEYLLVQGMPRLLDLYDKYNIKTTFFYTGHVAKLKPELVKMAYEKGHEIGSHGLTHDSRQAFDVLSYEEQVRHLKESKKILEDIIGEGIISFRAPAARVNNNIVQALEEAEFKIDSSISSQRFDMFMSYGSLKKLNWLIAHRKPYYAKEDNIFKKGESEILEIPISALFFPYIGTFMRIAPSFNRFIRNLLYLETKINNRHFNFLTHPNEFIDEQDEENLVIEKRSKNIISYFFKDFLRHKLKTKNLGEKAIPIFEKELQFFVNHNFEFLTCKELYNKLKNE